MVGGVAPPYIVCDHHNKSTPKKVCCRYISLSCADIAHIIARTNRVLYTIRLARYTLFLHSPHIGYRAKIYLCCIVLIATHTDIVCVCLPVRVGLQNTTSFFVVFGIFRAITYH